ncbi:methyltransferase [Streptomonospora salina]|uniref:2-polyprenyl-3-methyl-5-hydroxy-6-metoxy-1, 4-benzoquinol methylase n=1 Tax=Streptomonospora salina TaxID=104205 RepID=A0A841EA74_9ACTN|nr:methyltransferase [Streptomonospora salina]MBB6000025.1 2-polyprenyl-3-methyl-5-hydroxy-6-metoxy-1,4-benzoquinol methylase [Streptomonospora salina]
MQPKEIEFLLAQHGDVAQAAVVPTDASPGTDSAGSIGYVTLRALTSQAETRTEEQLTEWQEIYDLLYTASSDAAFGDNFAGWTSAYDRRPIDLDAMRQWRHMTVERVRELRPRRVLEIGVGSGLLLSRLAQDCDEYWATDLSSVAISDLARHISTDSALADRVTLRNQGAENVDGLPTEYFDTVVINSVVQVFPGAAYLTTVIDRVLTLLAAGGSFFIGDIRDLRTRDYIYAAIALRNPKAVDASAVHRITQRHKAKDEELFVHPDFFLDLARSHPAVTGVDIQLKQGEYHNELTRHRYDIVLHKSPSTALDVAECPVLRWGADVGSLDGVRELLTSSRPPLRVAGIPNARLAGEITAWQALAADDVARAEEALSRTGQDAVDPHTVALLASATGHYAAFAPSTDHAGQFDAVFLPEKGKSVGTRRAQDSGASQLADVPAATHRGTALHAELREWLGGKVPEQYLPTAIVALDDMPLRPDGTIDRAVLDRVSPSGGLVQ